MGVAGGGGALVSCKEDFGGMRSFGIFRGNSMPRWLSAVIVLEVVTSNMETTLGGALPWGAAELILPFIYDKDLC